jgi:hypothetical protein
MRNGPWLVVSQLDHVDKVCINRRLVGTRFRGLSTLGKVPAPHVSMQIYTTQTSHIYQQQRNS